VSRTQAMPERANSATQDRVAGIVRRLLWEQGLDRPIGDDDDLAENGLSSTDMVHLMLSVEAEFSIRFADREMRPANFRTISRIHALVRLLRPDC
jgi:acyl carrier protein